MPLRILSERAPLATLLALLASTALAGTAVAPAIPAPAAVAPFEHTTALAGLLPVHVDRDAGRILLTLPPAGPDGTCVRLLLATALRSGLGAAPTFLDRGRIGRTRLVAFRRLGRKVALVYENPRFRAASGNPSDDFATSTVWLGDIAATLPDGGLVVDIAGFLVADGLGIAASLNQAADRFGTGDTRGAGQGFKPVASLSAADAASVKAFPDNLEMDALQTFASDKPGAEVENIVPDPHAVSFTVHFSWVRLPDAGFVPREFDPRIGGFSTQVVRFGTPFGGDVVHDYANRFRLEKLEPAAARSRVRKPIVFYVDRAAPPEVRAALIKGIGWWRRAFDAAGYVDAFDVRELPAGVDPLDVRFNVVNWVDRATRGWSYGQQIVDPRTGEIVRGMVVLGSLRARQDIRIYQSLVGAAALGTGGPNDPARVALARLRQLGAHEVGHSLGFAHNFAASTQDRASVMDYPPPRIGLVDGKPDLSDAYGVGVGRWDMATVDWLYAEPPPGQDAGEFARAKAAAVIASGLRYVHDENARAPDTSQPWAALWDDGADPAAELTRLLRVRRAALDGFGIAVLAPGEPVAELRRRFVPIWLLHRYQLVAAAKAIGGVDFSYAVVGDGHEAAQPVAPAAQRTALQAVLGALAPEALTVPARLVPLLSAARAGSDDRQYDIEVIATAGGPVFDPLAASDVAADLALGTLLAPRRLARLYLQHAADPQALGVEELLDRLLATTLPPRTDALTRRVAFRTLATLAGVSQRTDTPPEVAALLDARLQALGHALAIRSGDATERAWASSLSRSLLDAQARASLAAAQAHPPLVPPGDPIGDGADGEESAPW